MKVQLVRHSFPDRPDWILIEETVSLGTIYEVMAYSRDFMIINEILREKREIEAYFVKGNHGEGWLPKVCFEMIIGRDESLYRKGN